MSDQGEKPKADMNERQISRRGFLKMFGIGAAGVALGLNPLDKAQAKAANPNISPEPGKPGEVFKPATISDPGPVDTEGRQEVDRSMESREQVKQVENITVIEQTRDGKAIETGKTLGEVGGPDLQFAKDVMNALKPTGFSWVTPDNVNYLVVGKEDKTLQESAQSQDSVYFVVNKDTKDGNGATHPAGSLFVIERESGRLIYLPLGEETAQAVNKFAVKSNNPLEIAATPGNIRYTVYDHNEIMVWVNEKPVAISNYVNQPPKSGKLYDSFVTIPKDLQEMFSNGFVFVSHDEKTPPIIMTPNGGQYVEDKKGGMKEFEITSINIANNTFVDSAGNRRKIRRLPEGSLGIIKDKKFEILTENTTMPSFTAIFEKWGENMTAMKDGEKVTLKVAHVKIPVNGRLIDTKFVFGENEVYSGVTKVNGGNSETGYRFMTYQDLASIVAPGTQVRIVAYSKEIYDEDINSGAYKLNTPERKLVYDMSAPLDSIKDNLKSAKSGKNIKDVTFVGSIAVPSSDYQSK